jgi:hypothetical protein
MKPDQREQLKRLFRVHVDPRGSATQIRLLRAFAKSIYIESRR